MTFLYGACYGPARATDTFCKDWFTTEYQDRWGSGPGRRGDLATLKALGFNLVRSYWWDQNNDHSAFLCREYMSQLGGYYRNYRYGWNDYSLYRERGFV
jgi:hypothetical protein